MSVEEKKESKFRVSRKYDRNERNKFEWSQWDKNEIEDKLDSILNVTKIDWDWQEDGLHICKLEEEGEWDEVILTHPRSAKAFLDAYMLGYDHGFGDGRK